MYGLWLYHENQWHNITAIVGNLSWQNTIAELATTMSFEVAKIYSPYTSVYVPQEGSIISVYTNEQIFRGIVLIVDDGSQTVNKYTVCDFAFYLNKSKETYQFNNMAVNNLLAKVCGDFGIDVDSICEIRHTISKIYMDKTIAEIIKDVLEISAGYTGYAYNFDVTPKGLRVYRLGDLKAYPQFRISPSTPLVYSPSVKGSVAHSISIEDMKNAVKVITGNEDGFSLLAAARNEQLISRFGLLQEVEKIEDDASAGAQMTADSLLSKLAVKKENYSFEMIEAPDSYTRAGYEIEVDGSAYIIEGAQHSIINEIHKVKLDLRRV